MQHTCRPVWKHVQQGGQHGPCEDIIKWISSPAPQRAGCRSKKVFQKQKNQQVDVQKPRDLCVCVCVCFIEQGLKLMTSWTIASYGWVNRIISSWHHMIIWKRLNSSWHHDTQPNKDTTSSWHHDNMEQGEQFMTSWHTAKQKYYSSWHHDAGLTGYGIMTSWNHKPQPNKNTTVHDIMTQGLQFMAS